MVRKDINSVVDVIIHYYEGIVLFGAVLIAIAVWLYKYHYAVGGDEITGMIAAALLFFGTFIAGQGVRGWRDGEDFRHRYVHMKSRHGAEIDIRKRKR
ncbi:MAG: hypothetical protein V1729_05315 [Candidatus Woesearchaeota archaeon]